MIIGLTTDMPASPGQADRSPTTRPAGHGVDFARVLTGQPASLPAKGGAHPERSAPDARQDDDTARALPDQPDMPDAKGADTPEIAEAALTTLHFLPEEGDISVLPPEKDLVAPATPENPHSRTAPPPQHAEGTEIAGHRAESNPQYKMSPASATPGQEKITPSHIAQLSLLAANIPSPAATDQTGTSQQAIAAAFYGTTSGLQASSPVLLPAEADPDRQVAMTGTTLETSPTSIPTGLPVGVASALHKMPPPAGPLRGLLDTTAGAGTPAPPLAPSESYSAMGPPVAALMRPPPAGWAHELAGTIQNAQSETAAPEAQSTVIDTPPIAATDGTGNHTTRTAMPLVRNDAAFSTSLAQAIQTAADSGKSIFELDILDGTGGKLRVSVLAVDGSVQVSILAGRADMLDMLKRSLNLLAADLTALGFTDVDLHLGNQGGSGAAHHLRISNSGPATAQAQNAEHPQAPPSMRGTGMDLRL
ncbi:hypothetical protein [Roseinatronobacter sp.]